jgi:SAM-dependent methyltransferase
VVWRPRHPHRGNSTDPGRRGAPLKIAGGRFTGERLHAEGADGAGSSALFSVDLARHRAAYRYATELWHARREGTGARGRLLDLGSGAGYGTAQLAELDATVIGLDRELPDRAAVERRPSFVLGEVERTPFRPASFDLVASFQVIEHLERPDTYLSEIARVLDLEGVALLTTPNSATSDGLNPYHVREYHADELREMLARHFGRVELLGVGCGARVAPYFESRRRALARVERLDFLRLRHRLPRALRLWLFARGAVVVRRALRRGGTLVAAGVEDFPIGPVDEATLDLLGVCSQPRR